MKINDLKDLERLLKLAQKLGAYQMEVDGVKFILTPKKTTKKSSATSLIDQITEENVPVPTFNGDFDKIDPIETDELTEEQMLMWSTGEVAQ